MFTLGSTAHIAVRKLTGMLKRCFMSPWLLGLASEICNEMSTKNTVLRSVISLRNFAQESASIDKESLQIEGLDLPYM